MEQLTTRKLPQRIATYVFGLFCSSIAINLFVYADLGNSAVTTSAVVFSQRLGFPLGTCTLVLYCGLVLAQIIIMGKEFQWVNLGQVPFAFIFGTFVNLVGDIMPVLTPDTLLERWLLQFIGLGLVAFGTLVFVGTELVPMPAEGFLLTLAKKTPLAFHQWKIIVDCTFASISVVFSMVFFGELVGVGVGTILLAVGTGWTMGKLKPRLPPKLQNWQST